MDPFIRKSLVGMYRFTPEGRQNHFPSLTWKSQGMVGNDLEIKRLILPKVLTMSQVFNVP